MSGFPRYKRHADVVAFKIGQIKRRHRLMPPASLLISAENESINAEVSEDWLSFHKPQVGGYFVLTAEGDETYRSAKCFESYYSPINKGSEG